MILRLIQDLIQGHNLVLNFSISLEIIEIFKYFFVEEILNLFFQLLIVGLNTFQTFSDVPGLFPKVKMISCFFLLLQFVFLQKIIKYFNMQRTIERDKKREWTAQQNSLLKELYPNYSSKRWKKISQLFKQSGFDRSQLQIRERWTNFQDPALLFTEWTDQQLQTLYKSYTKFGSKWCLIKKTIPGRTENKIKNKFYGNIRIFLRFVVNHFNSSKQDTMWIHKINPSILNDIYKGTQEFSSFGSEMEVAIQKMGYNVDKIQLQSRIESQQVLYKTFYEKIIGLFKSIQLRKQKQQGTGLRRIPDLSELNYGSQVEGAQNSQQNSQKKQKIQIQSIPSPYINSTALFSTNLNNGWPSGVKDFQPDHSNYPLLQMHNSSYPFYNYWFYPN